jgi:adenosylcobinamide kinase / adenosylcobinamide-phosphate guanylyltransferase
VADLKPGLTLITGGARSGKSSYALKLAVESGAPVLYVATALAVDNEMAERIQRHRFERPPEWRTLEEPLYPATSARARVRPGDVVLLDCLTVWLGNLVFEAAGDRPEIDHEVARRISSQARWEIDVLCRLPEEEGIRLIVVSNEVGWGIVPGNASSRFYRDLLGGINQQVAENAEAVFLMVAGCPSPVKGA